MLRCRCQLDPATLSPDDCQPYTGGPIEPGRLILIQRRDATVGPHLAVTCKSALLAPWERARSSSGGGGVGQHVRLLPENIGYYYQDLAAAQPILTRFFTEAPRVGGYRQIDAQGRTGGFHPAYH
jgi:hypothetical protein